MRKLLKECKVLFSSYYQGYWKRKLVVKFKNSRRRSDQSIPCVKVMKRLNTPGKENNSPSGTPKSKRLKPSDASDIIGNFPLMAEDAGSVAIHMESMMKENKKSSKNWNKITAMMTRTFGFRRKLVIEDLMPADQLTAKFPFLKDPNQVIIFCFN